MSSGFLTGVVVGAVGVVIIHKYVKPMRGKSSS